MRVRFEGEIAARQRRGLRRGAGLRSLQYRIDARHQFARAEWLGDVIIAADLEADHPVDLLVARGEEQDRRIRCLADSPAHFEAVHLGHADVEHDEIGRRLAEAAQRLGAVAGGDRLHAGLLQRETDDVADVGIIVGDENAFGHGSAPIGFPRRRRSSALRPADMYRNIASGAIRGRSSYASRYR